MRVRSVGKLELCMVCFSSNTEIVRSIGIDHNDIEYFYVVDKDADYHCIMSENCTCKSRVILQFPKPPQEPPADPDENNPDDEERYQREWFKWNEEFGDPWDMKLPVSDALSLCMALSSTGWDPTQQDWYVYLIDICINGSLPFSVESPKLIGEGQYRDAIEFAFYSGCDFGVKQIVSDAEIDPSDFLTPGSYKTEEDFKWFYIIFHRLSDRLRRHLWQSYEGFVEASGMVKSETGQGIIQYALKDWKYSDVISHLLDEFNKAN